MTSMTGTKIGMEACDESFEELGDVGIGVGCYAAGDFDSIWIWDVLVLV